MKKMLFGSVLALLVAAGCTKDPVAHLSEDESRIYITNYDTTAVFTNYKTFAIADSVAIVKNNRLQTKERTDYDVQLINAIANELKQKGYTQVSNSQNADLGVAVSIVTNTSTGLIQYGGYGGFYDSYWDPYYWGYGGYGYGYPSAYGLVQSTEAMISVDLLDLKNAPTNQNIRVIWNGLIRGSGIFSGDATTTGVQALFAQSSYLQANP